MVRRVGIVLVAALLLAGCGVRSSKPFTAAGSVDCLKQKGFTQVTTDPAKVGFIAGFAENGGLRAASPSGNVLTIAFAGDASGVPDTERAFRNHASAFYKRHIQDIMESSRNAVLVWQVAPKPQELSTAEFCLHP